MGTNGGEKRNAGERMASRTAQRSDRLFTVANGVSILRVALLPYLLFLISLPPGTRLFELVALATVIALTDFFDGFIARQTGTASRYGHIVDPLADKICLITTSAWLALYRNPCCWPNYNAMVWHRSRMNKLLLR